MLYLASQSPRRQELLQRLGLPFAVLDVEVPELRAPAETPVDYVRRVAAAKAAAGLSRLAAEADAVVIGADTEVVLDGDVFGKPRDAGDACAMLRRLSGRTHEVVSAVSVLSAGHGAQALCVSQVRFADLDAATIAAYVAGGEAFIAHLSGSYSAVMGLPLFETAGLLRQFALPPPFAGGMPAAGVAPTPGPAP